MNNKPRRTLADFATFITPIVVERNGGQLQLLNEREREKETMESKKGPLHYYATYIMYKQNDF